MPITRLRTDLSLNTAVSGWEEALLTRFSFYMKERLDRMLVERGLAESRTQAQALILAGQVLVDEQRVDKAGQKVSVTAAIRIKGERMRYVSRGGIKLESALNSFQIDPGGWHCLDVGASTGGFTDCMLQHGAASVVAIDVGHSQMVWQLRQNPKVEVREGVNARYLRPEDFSTRFRLITVDVSFISLSRILPVLPALLEPEGRLVTLIKPQFEVGRGEVGKGGLVTDPQKHTRVICEVIDAAANLELYCCGLVPSPITGADGNREFLACFTLEKCAFDLDGALERAVVQGCEVSIPRM